MRLVKCIDSSCFRHERVDNVEAPWACHLHQAAPDTALADHRAAVAWARSRPPRSTPVLDDLVAE